MNIFIRTFYNFGLFIASLVFLIKYLLKGRSMRDLLQRFYIPAEARNRLINAKKSPVWFHAVSVGEINVLATYLDYFQKQFPDQKVVVSTITPTGFDVANLKLIKYTDCIFYFPLDIYPVVRKFCKIVNPSKFVAMETELWPELYLQLNNLNVPICILNGRLSDKSFPKYLKHRRLLLPIMDCINSLGAQSETMKERFEAIGLASNKITITGNIKYAIKPAKAEILAKIQEKWSFLKNRKVIIAGSTHEPEEEFVLEAFSQLNKEFKDLTLVLCPRHIERSAKISDLCKKYNLDVSLYSNLSTNAKPDNVFILDEIGFLSNLYSIADIVLIGGSFIPHGGQNILEPAIYAKPTVVGPYMHNFVDIIESFRQNNAIAQIDSSNNIYIIFKELLTNPDYALNIGDNANKLIINESRSIELSNKLIAALF